MGPTLLKRFEPLTKSESGFAAYPSLRGRKVLVTGGASGIGEAFVARFAEQLALVAFLDVQVEEGNALAERVAREGHPRPVFLPCDLADTDATRVAVEEAVERLGGLDTVINNAGNDRRHATEQVTPELWDSLMAVNLRHQFFVTQAALPSLKKSGVASVINLSSISWMIPSTGLPVYVTAKAGILGLTRTLAHELGEYNIRVNCLLPGAIVTEKQRRLVYTPEYEAKIFASQSLKRSLVPDDVVRMGLFLAADDASAITGQGFVVDGGWV